MPFFLQFPASERQFLLFPTNGILLSLGDPLQISARVAGSTQQEREERLLFQIHLPALDGGERWIRSIPWRDRISHHQGPTQAELAPPGRLDLLRRLRRAIRYWGLGPHRRGTPPGYPWVPTIPSHVEYSRGSHHRGARHLLSWERRLCYLGILRLRSLLGLPGRALEMVLRCHRQRSLSRPLPRLPKTFRPSPRTRCVPCPRPARYHRRPHLSQLPGTPHRGLLRCCPGGLLSPPVRRHGYTCNSQAAASAVAGNGSSEGAVEGLLQQHVLEPELLGQSEYIGWRGGRSEPYFPSGHMWNRCPGNGQLPCTLNGGDGCSGSLKDGRVERRVLRTGGLTHWRRVAKVVDPGSGRDVKHGAVWGRDEQRCFSVAWNEWDGNAPSNIR